MSGYVSTSPEEGEDRYLLFHVGATAFACPLLSIKEIVEPLVCRPVPCTHPYFMGMVNLRGQLVGVVDLALKLGLSTPQHPEGFALLVFEGDATPLAVLVHRVESVLRISPSALTNDPCIESLVPRSALVGVARVEGGLLPVINLKSLLATDTLAA